MLLLGGKGFEVDGVTVGVDHADPNLWWHGPGPVALARGPDGHAAFTFIKYKPAAIQAGANGGGFVMFGTDLHLPEATRAKILAQASGLSPGQAVLEPLPFDEGTVKCVALNLEGAGGTHAQPAPAGAFNAVEQILGATTPSLEGDETAIFSLTLPQEGATILDQAYRQGTGPIGVIYTFKYTAMRPALDVRITADFKLIYQKFSASLEGQYYFLKVGIDAAFEELVQNGAIKIEVTNFTGDQDARDKEKWALDFFKDNLFKDWFQPTLTPGKEKATTAAAGRFYRGWATSSRQAAPARGTRAAPARVTPAVPARVPRAAPARVPRAAPARVTRAVPARVTRAVPARVTRAAPARVTWAAPARVRPAVPARVRPAAPARVPPAAMLQSAVLRPAR